MDPSVAQPCKGLSSTRVWQLKSGQVHLLMCIFNSTDSEELRAVDVPSVLADPSGVLARWSEVGYHVQREKEKEEFLLRRLAEQLDLPLPEEPFRTGDLPDLTLRFLKNDC